MKAELPLEFPDGTTPVTCRVSIYDSSTDKKVGVGSLMDKAYAPPLPAGSLYMEEVHVKVWFHPSSSCSILIELSLCLSLVSFQLKCLQNPVGHLMDGHLLLLLASTI